MEIRIGSKIEPEPIKSGFILHCRNMSGDGDHYEETTNTVDTPMDVFRLLRLYSVYWLMEGNDKYDDDKVLEKVKEIGNELGFKDNSVDLFIDMVGYDVTEENRLASPDELWVIFVDMQGSQFFVEFVVNEKVYTRFHSDNIKEVFNNLFM